MPKTTQIRARAFGGKLETITVAINNAGVVRVYDSVAGHFTTCHSLSAQEIGRAKAKIARG